MAKDIYDYVITEESAFSKAVSIVDGWEWSFKEHIRKSFLYKNSQFLKNNDNRDMRPFKNIIRPILNIQYRTEGFDVKDIELYVNDKDNYHKSFLAKKYHEDWAPENKIDTFIDEVVESFVDYGGVLVKNVSSSRPEVVSLHSIAFCDQTDILSGPFAIKHFYTPDALRDMESKGWGNPAKGATDTVENMITKAEFSKQYDKNNGINQTPGKYIEIYEVHGTFPEYYISGDSKKYTNQFHIIGFYKDANGNKQGVTLFAVKESKLPFKFLSRDSVFGRAVGFGAVEELFDAQTWTNYSEIQIMEMLGLASKIFFKTTDPTFKTKNNLASQATGAVFTILEGRDISQLDTSPRNITTFNNAIQEWNQHAQVLGAAGESLSGVSPASGTPFKLQELVTNEAKGIHIYRQGKIATFLDEIYRDWVLPYISKELTNDKEFITKIGADDFQKIAENVIQNRLNSWKIEKTLNGQTFTDQDVEMKKQELKTELTRNGDTVFLKWMKEDFKDIPIKVKTNIAGKQKNLALFTDKIVNVLRQVIATPQILQDPNMLKILNTILESSGLSPILFAPVFEQMPQQPAAQGGTEPLQDLSEVNNSQTTNA